MAAFQDRVQRLIFTWKGRFAIAAFPHPHQNRRSEVQEKKRESSDQSSSRQNGRIPIETLREDMLMEVSSRFGFVLFCTLFKSLCKLFFNRDVRRKVVIGVRIRSTLTLVFMFAFASAFYQAFFLSSALTFVFILVLTFLSFPLL